MAFMTGMQQQTIRANGLRLNAWVGGEGDQVVLLHGYPQTAQMWRKVAPMLLKRFTVVCPDLRGCGDSDKPRDDYDKRSMAGDIMGAMIALGFERFALVGHDRGARVAHRLAMDTWREKATDVRGHPLPCGRFIPEEAPVEPLRDLNTFLGGAH